MMLVELVMVSSLLAVWSETGENIAANTTHGYVWNTRTSNVKSDVDHTDHPEAFYGREDLRGSQYAPIQGFGDNEAFGTQVGLIVVKRGIEQNHDVRSVIDGFLNWETSNGIQLTYTSHYTLKDIDLIGTNSEVPLSNAKTGFDFGPKTFDFGCERIDRRKFPDRRRSRSADR